MAELTELNFRILKAKFVLPYFACKIRTKYGSSVPVGSPANVQKPENVVNRPIDGRTDKRVAGGHYCWGVLLWPPQLGLGGKCDKKWKFKNVEKITSFSDAVTLTFDLRPWKVNQVRTLSLPMCIPNLRTIHPVVFSYRVNTIAGGGRRVAGGGRLRRKTITSPDPSDTGDIIKPQNVMCT